MAQRSPSLSFIPTPAIHEDKENKHILEEADINSAGRQFDSTRPSKEVHFSPVTSPARRAQSVATSIPFLQPVSSASQLPGQKLNSRHVTSSIDVKAYIQEQSSFIKNLRSIFDSERNAWNTERRLWETREAMLKQEIADLKLALDNQKNPRPSSSGSVQLSMPSFRSGSDFSHFPSRGSASGSRVSSQSHTTPPVWEPESKPASRVFSEPDLLTTNIFANPEHRKQDGHLPSISEDGSLPILDREISPTTVPTQQRRAASEPMSVDKIDPTLDGITLKSSAFAPSFVARVSVSSPKVSSPRVSTPQRLGSPPSKLKTNGGLRLGVDAMLSPLDEKLKKHAGHTPMAISGNASTGPSSGQSTELPTPVHENPIAPAPTAKRPPPRPRENADSYFSTVANEDGPSEKRPEANNVEAENEDPALQGPLNMSSSNDNGQSNSFLTELDAKLLAQAQRYIKSPDLESQASEGPEEIDDGGPRLKMKKSMNFGSAWGSSKSGKF